MSLNEFDIINTYFIKPSARKDVLLGIGDDCAVLNPPPDKELLVSTDTLNLNQHFFPDTSPFDVGYRSVAVSLSDIAAMGGHPAWMLLSLSLPDVNEAWLSSFSEGLFSLLAEYQVELVGGNTSKGPLSITTQVTGWADQGRSMKRSGAVVGDLIYTTYTLGSAALALAIAKQEQPGELFQQQERMVLNQALWRPMPRVKEGLLIAELAHAAIDISDGLLADLNHIVTKSGVGAVLYLDQIPLSSALKKIPINQRYQYALNGGDDYELCFTVPAENKPRIMQLNETHNHPFTCIGEITQQSGIIIKDSHDQTIAIDKLGYRHF